MLHSQSSDYEKAEEVYLRGIEAIPNDAELHFNLGIVFDKLERFDDMAGEMRKAIELDPAHENALNYLGYSYADRGINLDEAVSLVERALAIKPDSGAYIDSLGWAYYKKGWFDKAIDKLKRASELITDDPVILEHLGDVYLKKNMKAEAKEEWIKALRMDIANEKLIAKFKEAGFGDPFDEERLKEKLEEYKKTKTIEQQKDQNPKGEGLPSMQNHLITTSSLIIAAH
jgi:Flp pilus assembly protein TadD